MLRWLLRQWRARQRAIDIQILWPACVREAKGNMDVAKAAFALHCYHDSAWSDLKQDELYTLIDGL